MHETLVLLAVYSYQIKNLHIIIIKNNDWHLPKTARSNKM